MAAEGTSQKVVVNFTQCECSLKKHISAIRNGTKVDSNDCVLPSPSGLAPHCLDILKMCHMLTNKLVGMTMGSATELQSPETLTDLVAIAKRIGPRVDDVVHSMYPPLDPRLLEARFVSHPALVMLFRLIDFVDNWLVHASYQLISSMINHFGLYKVFMLNFVPE